MAKSPPSTPPPLSLRIIQTFCRDELVEEIEGNLCEYYAERPPGALNKLLYWFEVLRYIRFSTLRSINTQITGSMFVFNPLLTFRNLLKHRAATFISLLGFTLGLVATLFLYFYISTELSTDDFHADGDKIYRFLRVGEMNGQNYKIGLSSAPYAEALANDFPNSMEEVTRAMPQPGLITIEDQNFVEDGLLFADSNFFQFFSFPLAIGDESQVLRGTNSAVLSQAMATKYFGSTDPIGKELTLDSEFSFVVTGILGEMPARSHLEFDMVLSIGVYERFESFSANWWNNSLYTYARIPSEEVVASLEAGLNEFMIKYMGDMFEATGSGMGLMAQPLREIYFDASTRYDFVRHGNLQSIYILTMVAFGILFIACFNYVNLSIAQSFLRSKEVGVRKVLGVNKGRLALQFLGESMLILSLSFAVALVISWFTIPTIGDFLGIAITPSWGDQQLWVFLVILFLVMLLISGAQPAMLMSSFRPLSALKGLQSNISRQGVRKVLVIAQFAISIFLIVATLLINAQNDYLASKDLGFNQASILLIRLNSSEIRSQRELFKERLEEHPAVTQASMMSGEPGGFYDASTFIIPKSTDGQRLRTLFTDVHYLNLFDIDVIAGRGFSKDITTDESQRVLLNRKAVEGYGLTPEEVLNQPVELPGWGLDDLKIIGVVEDFHFLSLHEQIEPLAIITGGNHRRLALKVKTAELRETLAFIEDVHKELSPAYPLEYEFLDDRLARLYEQEQQQARVFTAFSGISILLACLGIFGLAAYSAQRRQKELGIRKVLGASVSQIIELISREFLMLVIIATVLALPAVWYFISNWLKDFAYRILILDYWYAFLLGGIAATAIALFTVTLKTFQSAAANPTESIRNE
ncbi:MAG: ABC transporter permease [Bacteroidota bacterium]